MEQVNIPVPATATFTFMSNNNWSHVLMGFLVRLEYNPGHQNWMYQEPIYFNEIKTSSLVFDNPTCA